MDAPRQKHTLLSDVHVASRQWTLVERVSRVDTRSSVFVGSRPLKYALDITSAPRPSKQGTYARFYRKAVAKAERTIAESAPGQALAHQAVVQARVRAETPRKRDYAAPRKKKAGKRSSKHVRRVANVLVAVAIIMSGVMGFMVYRYHLALKQVEAMPLHAATGNEQDDAASASAAATHLDEAIPAKSTGGSSGRLAVGTPYTISIPKLKISSASIIGVGLTKKGAMNVPGNIWQVGWYKTSAKPADNTGVVVMNGHVHGPTQPGIFANLTKLKPGDLITVKDAGGTTYTYKVDSLQTFKAGEAEGSLQQSASPTKQGLNLVTCTGEIKDDEYLSRLVVFAVRV